MTVIKRDGTEVEFDKEKIVVAILKANKSVPENERIEDASAREIATGIEEQCAAIQRQTTVEEIQDMVESNIMERGAYTLAKHYITYRYQRASLRQANTTDEKILNLIDLKNEEVKQENSNKNPTVNSTQRDYMAGEVSKDLTERLLLPPDIVAAHKED